MGNFDNLSFSLMIDLIVNKGRSPLEQNEFPFLYYAIEIAKHEQKSGSISLNLEPYWVKECPELPKIPFVNAKMNTSFIEYPTLEIGHYCIMNIKKITEEYSKRNNNKNSTTFTKEESDWKTINNFN